MRLNRSRDDGMDGLHNGIGFVKISSFDAMQCKIVLEMHELRELCQI